jgi:hypothetical protein
MPTANSLIKNPAQISGILLLSDQGSNLDFPESKSGVLPVTPSDNHTKTPFSLRKPHFGIANVE